MAHSRRKFLQSSAALTVGAVVTPHLLRSSNARASDFGTLLPDPAGILDLPAGFTYTLIDQRDDDMSDGYKTPGLPDGMACFFGPTGEYVLMRNHEVSAFDTSNGALKNGQNPPDEMYNPIAMGGVTRVVIDSASGSKISSNWVLGGTLRNCAGGPSPWGWLSCEETDTSGHGYVFLAKSDASSIQTPQRIDAYGRCNHEAVAIDPLTYTAYLTEDRGDSCLYRMVPASKETPFEGQLQALKIVGEETANLGTGRQVGDRWSVEWMELNDPSSPNDTLRSEAQDMGAAIIKRGEGIWYHEGAVYICSTSGGPFSKGQIFKLTLETQELELIAQSEDPDVLDMPDNICVSPWGDLYMSEDGDGDQYIRYLDASGNVRDFARNALSGSELAGVCFSPDGKALFINIQKNHRTYMIRGPFPEVDIPDVPSPNVDPETTTESETETEAEKPGGCSAVRSDGVLLPPLAALAHRWAVRAQQGKLAKPDEQKSVSNAATRDQGGASD